jgi:hypothetical protein
VPAAPETAPQAPPEPALVPEPVPAAPETAPQAPPETAPAATPDLAPADAPATPQPAPKAAPAPKPVPAAPAGPPPPPRPPPRRVEDLLTPEGVFRPDYPALVSAWEAYADRLRSSGVDPLAPREWALSQTRGGPRRLLDALLPSGWRGSGRTVYPGARPEAVALDVGAPRPGTPVGDTGQRWTQRIVRTEELFLRVDPAGDQYWSFPDLRPGEVLVLPNGSRVWLDPQTGEIVDVNPVGPSLGRRGRRVTRGQDAIFGAEDLSQEHVDAGTQRLHGATSPGLGGDAPYSIAAGPPGLNLVLENAGIEQWVRNLRDNAPPGVVYVFTTRTKRSPRGDLLHRSYQIDALEGGQTTQIASFDIGMRGRGITDADIDVEGWHYDAGALEKYGSPILRAQPKSAPPGGGVRVDIPRTLRELAGGGDARDPKPVSPLTEPLQQAQEARARLGDLAMRAEQSPRTAGGVGEALFELDDAMIRAEERLAAGSLDPQSVQQLAAVSTRINQLARIRTRTDRLQVGELVALARILDRIGAR